MKSLVEISHNQRNTFNFVEVKVKFTGYSYKVKVRITTDGNVSRVKENI